MRRPFPRGIGHIIHGALHAAAARGVRIKLLIADWNLMTVTIPWLRSLAAILNVEIRATIPTALSGPIPYAASSTPI